MIRASIVQRTIALVTAAMLGSGCVSYTTYGYQYRMQQEFGGGEEPEAAPVEARQLLAGARTVAFFPPDICINTDASGNEARMKQLRANCGVLLSTLERAAERAGYEVLSWQNLRGGKRPIDFAREANVDVLFEINEFALDPVDDSQIQRTLSFFERSDAGIDSPLNVSTPTAQGCREYANQADPAKTAALSGTIDIKTVSVADGRARWRYRKTLSESLGRSYPQVTFTAPRKPNKLGILGVTLGSIAIGVGGGLFIAEQVSTDDPLTPQNEKFDSGGLSIGLLVVGALAIGAGIAVQATAGGTKPEPETVLCNAGFASAPVVVPTAVAPGPMSAEHTFTEQTVGDAHQKEREKIRDTMIAQFIEVLKDAHGNAPRAPVPSPQPPPPAPAPAQ